jgi:hypothetical protein
MMKYYQLSSAFGKIGKELELPEYLKEICSHIASGNISRESDRINSRRSILLTTRSRFDMSSVGLLSFSFFTRT